MQNLIITAAVTGAEVTREQQPALPLTPVEIAIAAAECAEAGASIAHVHGRLPDGRSTQSAEVYAQIIEETRKRSDIIIQVSTGGAVGMSAEERLAPVRLRPEMATLSMGTVNFGDDIFVNHPADMAHFAQVMQDEGVVPEYEIFDAGMLSTLLRWVRKGQVNPDRFHVDFVMGIPGGMAANAETLLYLRQQLPAQASWTVAGVGAAQLPMAALGVTLGGHVRVGFEDNVYFRKGELASSNAQLVKRVADLSRLMERPVATPDQARAMLGLPLKG